MPEETPTTRLETIVGAEGLARLAEARVMVLGLGGVGSACAESLARGGVGRLVLVDRDVVAPSNMNRQVVARASTLGRPKAEAMRELLADAAPACEVEAHVAYLAKDTLADQLDALPRPDYVVDAIDTIAQKLLIAAWANARGLRLVSCMGSANRVDPLRLRFADVSETRVDPMAKVMRKECRLRGIGPLEVLYSEEPPVRVAAIDELAGERPADRSQILGTMSYLPPIMGHALASKVIRELLWPGRERP